jgi:hypothetical protein
MDEQDGHIATVMATYLIGIMVILGIIVIVILMRQKETHFIRDSQGNIISIIER